MSDGSGRAAGLEPSGFFVLRTPLLPFEAFSRSIQSSGARVLAAQPEVADAVYLASPSLVNALASDRRERALPKLAAYLTRAASRSTPFGLFAGCTVGTLAETTRLQLRGASAYERHTRLDNDYLFALVSALEADTTLRPALRWRPNSSLYRAGGRWRYAEARVDGTLRSYHLVAVEDSDAIATVLNRAVGGATVAELAVPLVDDDVGGDDAAAFIGELIDAQLLVSDLELQVTGPEPLDTLIDRLSGQPAASFAVARLSEVRTVLAKLDAAGPGAPSTEYGRVAALLSDLPAPVEPARLLQVDMIKSAEAATLGPAVVRELDRAVGVLHRLWRPPEDDELGRFRDAFLVRFEDREVPLTDALDEDLGIAFGSEPLDDMSSPLLAGLDFPPPPGQPAAWTARDEFLLTRVGEALREGAHELRLNEDDLIALAAPERPPLPDAIEVMATLLAPSPAAVDGGDFRLLVHGVSGPPGARLLGRFCHSDERLHHLVADHLRREEACRPEAVFAEIAHLPEGRLGNILCRPVLRAFEIPYLGGSGASLDAQLPITDLAVSVRDGRVVLRSRRLGREVLPRLTTAHNFGYRTLGVYRFLCALQGQAVAASLRWDWGPLARAPRLPRVTSGRLVLARAQWTLQGPDLVDLPHERLPRMVVLADGDNELMCDLDEPLSVDALRRQLKGRDHGTLLEQLPRSDKLCVAGPEGRFVHELVVPFVRAGASALHPAPAAAAPASIARRFPPGSEWLYAKLFTGTGSADGVLVDAVRPLVSQCLADGLADSWFFVRYGDGGWHLRLRLHGEAAALLPRLHDATEPLLADGRLWKVQLDTYEREVERYGGDAGMELSEAVFRHDSDAVAELVALLPGDEGLDARWRLALAGTDRLLDDLGFSLAEKAEWARGRRGAFGAEFRVDAKLGGQLGRRFRAERVVLEDLLAADEVDHPLGPALAVLTRRSRALAAPTAELRRRRLPLGNLAASYAHMYANRLLRAGHRAQELVIHDFLARLYWSRLHRG